MTILHDSCEMLKQYMQASENELRDCQNHLMNQKVITDKQKNKIIKLNEEASLSQLDQEIIGNQLQNLYKAIENLSSKKFVEDKFTFELNWIRDNYK